MQKFFKHGGVQQLIDALLPVFATFAALLVGTVMLLFLGVNPLEAYAALWEGAFGSTNAIAETLVKATPLLLVGLGICIAFRANVIYIGGEGQMIIGGIFATQIGLTFTELPGWLVIILAIFAGFLGGALWGGIPGFTHWRPAQRKTRRRNYRITCISQPDISPLGRNFTGSIYDPFVYWVAHRPRFRLDRHGIGRCAPA